MEEHGRDSGAAGEWLVVYGSLMRALPRTSGPGQALGSHAPEAADAPDLLDQLGVGAGLRRVGPCRLAGALFDLGPYPALRRASGDVGTVCGELHAILDPAVLTVLDAFEGYVAGDPAGSDYLRERITLLEPRGVRSWIYVYNRAVDPRRRIDHGDWRAHLAARGASAHDGSASQAAKRG